MNARRKQQHDMVKCTSLKNRTSRHWKITTSFLHNKKKTLAKNVKKCSRTSFKPITHDGSHSYNSLNIFLTYFWTCNGLLSFLLLFLSLLIIRLVIDPESNLRLLVGVINRLLKFSDESQLRDGSLLVLVWKLRFLSKNSILCVADHHQLINLPRLWGCSFRLLL